MIIYFESAKPHIVNQDTAKDVLDNILYRKQQKYVIISEDVQECTIDFGGCSIANSEPIELIKNEVYLIPWHFSYLMEKLSKEPRIVNGIYKIHAGYFVYCFTKEQYTKIKQVCFSNQRSFLEQEAFYMEKFGEAFSKIK